MPDVNLPDQRRVDLVRLARLNEPIAPDHQQGRMVGVLGHAMQCQSCGTVCLPRHESMTLTDNDTGRTWTIPGAWVGPPGDPHRHLFPFVASGQVQQNTTEGSQQNATEPATKPRPAGIPAGAPKRSKRTPSRSKEARRAEYLRAKRKRAQRV